MPHGLPTSAKTPHGLTILLPVTKSIEQHTRLGQTVQAIPTNTLVSGLSYEKTPNFSRVRPRPPYQAAHPLLAGEFGFTLRTGTIQISKGDASCVTRTVTARLTSAEIPT